MGREGEKRTKQVGERQAGVEEVSERMGSMD